MTIKQLEIFLTLAHTLNTRKTAEKHFLSQAAVSSSLHALEEELNVQLFDRVSNRLVLNDKGVLLSDKIKPILDNLKEVFALVSLDSISGNVRVGASSTLADFVMPQIVYDINKSYQNVEVKYEAGNTDSIAKKVEKGEYDIGFVEGIVRNINLAVSSLIEEKLIIVTCDKEFAEAKDYTMAELMDYEWLIREEGSATRAVFLDTLTSMGLRPKKFMEFNHYKPINSLLANKGTLACLSHLVIKRELAYNEFHIVNVKDATFTRKFYKIEHKDKQNSSISKLLSDQIRKAISDSICDSNDEAIGECIAIED